MDAATAGLMAALLTGHFLGDFSPLSTRRMIAAKESGASIGWILAHASVHAVLVALAVTALAFPGVGLLAIVVVLELGTHFAIDLFRARLGVRRPRLADPSRRGFWFVLGLDQLAHGLVLVAVALIVGGA